MNLKEKLFSIEIPIMENGVLDLSKWEEYIEKTGFNLQEAMTVRKKVSLSSLEGMLLDKAIREKRNEIAINFVRSLASEDLTVSNAISILELAKEIIGNSNFEMERGQNNTFSQSPIPDGPSEQSTKSHSSHPVERASTSPAANSAEPYEP